MILSCWWRECRRVLRLVGLIAHVSIGVFLSHVVFAMAGPFIANRHEWESAVTRWWMRGVLRLLGVSMRIEGSLSVGPALIVANHISWLDIICLRSICDAAFVAKSAVRRWPVFGALAARAGTIFIRRGETNAVQLAADEITWRLAQHQSIVIFPEGTTTNGADVRRFFPRLYQAAIRTRTPIQALAFRYGDGRTPHPTVPFVDSIGLVPHLWTMLRESRIDATLTACRPIESTLPRRALAELTHQQIADVVRHGSAPVYHDSPRLAASIPNR